MIQRGDLVLLKHFNVEMLVEAIDKHGVHVVWFDDNGVLHRDLFDDAELLEKVVG